MQYILDYYDPRFNSINPITVFDPYSEGMPGVCRLISATTWRQWMDECVELESKFGDSTSVPDHLLGRVCQSHPGAFSLRGNL